MVGSCDQVIWLNHVMWKVTWLSKSRNKRRVCIENEIKIVLLWQPCPCGTHIYDTDCWTCECYCIAVVHFGTTLLYHWQHVDCGWSSLWGGFGPGLWFGLWLSRPWHVYALWPYAYAFHLLCVSCSVPVAWGTFTIGHLMCFIGLLY